MWFIVWKGEIINYSEGAVTIDDATHRVSPEESDFRIHLFEYTTLVNPYDVVGCLDEIPLHIHLRLPVHHPRSLMIRLESAILVS